jgi:tetratricopeptide (TPR) repeat protein
VDTVLYPDPQVQALFSDLALVPFKANIEDDAPLSKQFNVSWTPTFVFADGEGRAHHRAGPVSLPLAEFVPVVLASVGRARFSQGRYDDALGCFDQVVDRHAESLAAPEAMYWRGVAHYRKGDKDRLMRSWKDLSSRHPESYWAKAVTFLGK